MLAWVDQPEQRLRRAALQRGCRVLKMQTVLAVDREPVKWFVAATVLIRAVVDCLVSSRTTCVRSLVSAKFRRYICGT